MILQSYITAVINPIKDSKNYEVHLQNASSKFHRHMFYDFQSLNSFHLKTVARCTESLMALNVFILHIKHPNDRRLCVGK